MLSVTVERPGGRIGAGSGDHCAHEAADFRYMVTDWEPFDYFSTRFGDPAREGITMPETYHLMATETGTELRYTIGQAMTPTAIVPKIRSRDRKSTRLNSSHVVISYAVFCLKKITTHNLIIPFYMHHYSHSHF